MGQDRPRDPRLVGSAAVAPHTRENGLDLALRELAGRVGAAAGCERSWSARIAVGLAETLAFLDEDPQRATLLVLEAPAEAQRWLALRLCDALRDVLVATRGTLIVGTQLAPSPQLLSELVVGALFARLRSAILRDRARTLAQLEPSLAAHVIDPYLRRGAARADGAVEQPAGRAGVRAEVVPVRATSSHVRTLAVLASAPGLSNRQIETAARVSEHGTFQVLKRLRQRGLIENTSSGRPNAWMLTPYGHTVLELLGARFAPAMRWAA